MHRGGVAEELHINEQRRQRGLTDSRLSLHCLLLLYLFGSNLAFFSSSQALQQPPAASAPPSLPPPPLHPVSSRSSQPSTPPPVLPPTPPPPALVAAVRPPAATVTLAQAVAAAHLVIDGALATAGDGQQDREHTTLDGHEACGRQIPRGAERVERRGEEKWEAKVGATPSVR